MLLSARLARHTRRVHLLMPRVGRSPRSPEAQEALHEEGDFVEPPAVEDRGHRSDWRIGRNNQLFIHLDPPVGVSWLDYPTLPIGFQTGHPLEGPGRFTVFRFFV